MHSTRGRSRLLFEMLRGETLKGGWREPAVKEALDLCLSCKGCKGECPVQVDMASYKAEFLSHYYQGRLRPASAYAFGMIDRWSRMASHAPRLLNFFSQNAAFASLARRAIGISPQRRLPTFALQSFSDWFAERTPPPSVKTKAPVLLWPDTFSNYFHPEVARAAVEVLEHAGCEVRIPRVHLCCGRPLYEFGMLDRAKAYLQRTLDTLADEIRAGMPIIGLEPACLSVFREELPQLFPLNEQAKRLSKQVFLLSEYLQQQTPEVDFGALSRPALVQAHCHHKAIFKTSAEESVMKRLGLDYTLLDSGCCGMAGSFGFERDKYEVSMKCAERVLLPAVRAADDNTLIIADGFSCREQIVQCTQRKPLHLAQVLQLAMNGHATEGA
jgi:Fe-S oxidoreductase